MSDDDVSQDIAIIGYGGRFPGAATLDDWWRMLAKGARSARALDPAEAARLALPHLRSHPDYVAVMNEVDEVEAFDAGLFGFTQREAEALDPQRRMLFECVLHAFEDAGQVPGRARTGVYVGTGQSEYFMFNLAWREELFETLGGMLLGTLNGQDFAATHLAYKFDLHGPAVNVNTACSSSLVALHHAVNALLGRECDLALAGGASFALSQRYGYVHKPGGINSASGHCRPFDDGADGTLPGSGAGAVLLKRLADAIRDGDPVRAVVRATAINNDGARKVGFTAPSVDGQVEVIREALAVADVGPDDLDMVETHGTGTLLGDAVEIAALRDVFGTERASPLWLGAVKGNVGHLNAAAGVAALIKTTMCLERRSFIPVAGLRLPGHGMDAPGSMLRLPDGARPWEARRKPRLAGVSSFGIGGTNAHAILAEAPARVASGPAASRPQLLALSAHSGPALETLVRAVAGRWRTPTGSGWRTRLTRWQPAAAITTAGARSSRTTARCSFALPPATVVGRLPRRRIYRWPG
jgi:phthiocerol/phenolphthiocerol synthesis type-I polyketide synthase E